MWGSVVFRGRWCANFDSAKRQVMRTLAKRKSQPRQRQCIAFVVCGALLFYRLAMPQFSTDELATMDRLVAKGAEAKKIVTNLQAKRARRHEPGPSPSAVYKFLAGDTHQRDKSETRGRPSKLPRGLVREANAQRLKLIRAAKNEWMVTWEDIYKATKKALRAKGLLTRQCHMPSQDWLRRVMRKKTSVRSRPGKRRIARTSNDEEKRFEKGVAWKRHPTTFWTKDVHAFIDTKKFVCPRNDADRKLMRATKVTHHLRTASEGSEHEFLLPRRSHMLFGIPSIDVTAAVGNGRVFFWHVSKKPWNGEAAANMYHQLGQALRRRYPRVRRFRVVEDGDTKGFQSGAGVRAKQEERITSMKLPPRTPSWMPWDYSLWGEVEKRTLSNQAAIAGVSTYEKRLRLTGLRLPSELVEEVLGKMRENIGAVVAAKGKHTKLD